MKNIKKIFAFVIAVACAFTSMISAKAIDSTATFSYEHFLETQYKYVGAGTTVKKAKFASGSEVYALCFNHAKEAPGVNTPLFLVNSSKGTFVDTSKSTKVVLTAGQIASLKNRMPAYVYIINNGIQPNSTWNDSLFTDIANNRGAFTLNEKYYTTQLALWGVLYQDDTANGVNIESLNQTQAGTGLNNSLLKVKEAAIRLRDKALANKIAEPTISINQSKAMYPTADRKYFRTDDYTVSGTGFAKYVVNVPAIIAEGANNPEIVNVSTGKTSLGQMELNAGEKFYVRVAYSRVKNVQSGTIRVSAVGMKRNVAVYAPLDQTKQNIIIDFAESKKIQTETKYTATEEKGGLKVTKVYTNAAGVTAKLSGVRLQILDKDGKVVKDWTTNETNNPATFNDLKVGETYTIHEVSAPDTKDFKYIKSGDIKVTIEPNKVVERTVINTGTTDVIIRKTDATTGKELPGAKLELKDATGKIVDSWVSTDTPHVVKNKDRQDGKLIPGRYCLKETIAPEGYQMSSEEVCFMVNDDGGVDAPVVMENKPKTSVKISKQDITTKKELPGAKLIIKDKEGNVVDSWTSGTKPHYVTLPDGDYKLIEVTAPQGYGLSEEVKDFTIKAGQAEKTIVMTNSPIPVTADMNIKLIVGSLICTVLLVGFSLFKLNKQQEA